MTPVVILSLTALVALAVAAAAIRASFVARAAARAAVQVTPAVLSRLDEAPAGIDVTASLHGAVNAPSAGPDVGDLLSARVDRSNLRPELAPWVEIKIFRLRWGNDYALAANLRDLLHMQIEVWEARVMQKMDGSRTLRELIVEHLEEGGEFDADTIVGLVTTLEETGYLLPEPVEIDKAVTAALQPPRSPSRTIYEFVKTLEIRWDGAESFVRAWYRYGMRWFFHPLGVAVALLIAAGGIAAFIGAETSGRFTIELVTDPLETLVLILLGFVLTFFHEMGHALVLIHHDRRVKHAGFMLYFGSPSFFVDATDGLMLDRRPRMIQSLAGPFGEAILAGLSSIFVFAFPDLGVSRFLYTFAALNYFVIVLNLVPLLELDGYWLLSDFIQVPDLRPRSLQFTQHDLWHKLRRHERFSLQEVGLGIYGLLGVLFSVSMLLTAALFWRAKFGHLFLSLWESGLVGRALILMLVLLFGGPVIRGMQALIRTGVARAKGIWRKIKFRLETSWRVEAASLIDALPAFEDLPGELLSDLAGHVELRSYRPGQPAFRQGDRADSFYVVRRGTIHIEVEHPETGDIGILNTLRRGDSFGELGLLDAAPRRATARAADEVDLFRVDKGTFDRLLADQIEAPQFADTLQSLAELRELGPFRHLTTEELSDVLEHGAWVTAKPGETVIEEGERGDAFYAIEAGKVEIVRGGHLLGTVSAGGFFGELALLRDAPRSASVIASTPMRAFCLDRDGFDRLVADAFQGGRLRETVDRTWEH